MACRDAAGARCCGRRRPSMRPRPPFQSACASSRPTRSPRPRASRRPECGGRPSRGGSPDAQPPRRIEALGRTCTYLFYIPSAHPPSPRASQSRAVPCGARRVERPAERLRASGASARSCSPAPPRWPRRAPRAARRAPSAPAQRRPPGGPPSASEAPGPPGPRRLPACQRARTAAPPVLRPGRAGRPEKKAIIESVSRPGDVSSPRKAKLRPADR